MKKILKRLRKETNYQENIIIRKKTSFFKSIYIIFNETITSSQTISDFIFRSLNKISFYNYKNITNHISNYKYKKINTYDDLTYHLNSGFTIILINKNTFIALETKKNLSRSISTPITENTQRGPLDSFTENIENNIGLIKRRIKSNDLWIKNYQIGKYTKTSLSIIYIKSITNPHLVEYIFNKIKNINIDGIISTGTIRNLLENENKNIFPNIMSSEKPYTASKYLLNGHIIITIDNDPFVLILPITLNDFFLSEEDSYNKGINVTLTRITRYTSFFITVLTPAIYLALTTYNQEIIPTSLLTSIAAQRESVPFSGFTEAMLMIISFEILRESDLKIPSFASSALSIVGALILGEAAVSAGIVSPIMIIVIAITAISSLTFIEPEFINALRWYRFLAMLGASFSGIYGVILTFIYMIINICSANSFNLPYLSPFAPFNKNTIKDSIIKYPEKDITKRDNQITKNIIKEKNYEN